MVLLLLITCWTKFLWIVHFYIYKFDHLDYVYIHLVLKQLMRARVFELYFSHFKFQLFRRLPRSVFVTHNFYFYWTIDFFFGETVWIVNFSPVLTDAYINMWIKFASLRVRVCCFFFTKIKNKINVCAVRILHIKLWFVYFYIVNRDTNVTIKLKANKLKISNG